MFELYLSHGRNDPAENLDDWGFEGPRLSGVVGIHETYRSTLRVIFASPAAADEAANATGWEKWDANELAMPFEDDLVRCGEGGAGALVYFGDWGLIIPESVRCADTVRRAALGSALRFVRGFEGDEGQPGIGDLIAQLQAAAGPDPAAMPRLNAGPSADDVRLFEGDAAMIRDALDVLSPDGEQAQRRRERLLRTVSALVALAPAEAEPAPEAPAVPRVLDMLGFTPELGGGGAVFASRYFPSGWYIWATGADGGQDMPTETDFMVCAYPPQTPETDGQEPPFTVRSTDSPSARLDRAAAAAIAFCATDEGE